MNTCACELCREAGSKPWPPLPALDPVGIEAAIDRVELLLRQREAEIERLRAALLECINAMSCHPGYIGLTEASRMAREALRRDVRERPNDLNN